MDFLLNNKTALEAFALIATTVGAFSVPFAVFLFYMDKRKQRLERELATYNILASEYREFLKLCLENSDLQIYDYKPNTKLQLSGEQKVKQLILFEILVSMFESAFFQYRIHSTSFKEAQWAGWNQYMSDWCKRDDFRAAWNEHLGSEFDKDFLEHISNIFKECSENPSLEPKPDKTDSKTSKPLNKTQAKKTALRASKRTN